jgi:disulfide oxidoreductase YuzD
MLTYETWILPTIIINGKIVARGYKPSDKEILQNLKR